MILPRAPECGLSDNKGFTGDPSPHQKYAIQNACYIYYNVTSIDRLGQVASAIRPEDPNIRQTHQCACYPISEKVYTLKPKYILLFYKGLYAQLYIACAMGLDCVRHEASMRKHGVRWLASWGLGCMHKYTFYIGQFSKHTKWGSGGLGPL